MGVDGRFVASFLPERADFNWNWIHSKNNTQVRGQVLLFFSQSLQGSIPLAAVDKMHIIYNNSGEMAVR